MISGLDALSISETLGNDPLIIALYDQSDNLDYHNVISNFISDSLSKIANDRRDYPITEYRIALQEFAISMLRNKNVSPMWSELRGWKNLNDISLKLILHIVE